MTVYFESVFLLKLCDSLFFSSFCFSGRRKDPVPSQFHWDLLSGGCADLWGREEEEEVGVGGEVWGSEQLRFLSRSEGENLQQTVVLL